MEIPTHLINQIRAGKVFLFLGAGASKGAVSPNLPAGIPLGDQLGELLTKQFLGGDPQNLPLATIAEYCITVSDLVTVQQFVRDVFEPFEPADFHEGIANFRWAGIVTTNYDQVIEKAYARNTKRLQTPKPFIKTTDRVDFELRQPDALPFIKLHGCVSLIDDARYPLILTTDQYVTHRSGRERLFDRFKDAASEYSFVYVGYSLQDPDIRRILLELQSPELSRPMHYVVGPNPSPWDIKVWETKRITSLAGTLKDFIEAASAAIPTGLRAVATPTRNHPIGARFVSHASASPSLDAFLQNDVAYIHGGMNVETPNPQAFYRGASHGWSSIEAGLDAKRNLTDTILTERILRDEVDRSQSTDFYLIHGHAGSGKTVALKRVAYDAGVTFNKPVLFLRSDSRLMVEPFEELCHLIGERVFLFLDNAARRVGELDTFLRVARSKKLPITLLAAEKTNEWNVEGSDLASTLLDGKHELRQLSLNEIDALIEKLDRHNCLGELKEKSADERKEAFLQYAKKQLLVALHEITSGADFVEIVYREYQGIASDTARLIYRTVCSMNRLNVPVRAGLVHRLTGVSFSQFKESFFSPLESVVLTEEYRTGQSLGSGPPMDFAYRARHPWVAQVVYEKSLPTESERFDQTVNLLSALDVGYTADRVAFRELIRARNLREIFSDPRIVEQIFLTAERSNPGDGYLFQQRAIYELTRPSGNLSKAYEWIVKAREALPHDKSIIHTISQIELARASTARNDVERRHHLDSSQQHAKRLTGASALSSHGYSTLARLHLIRLKEVLSNPVLVEEIASVTKQVEDALAEGFERFRNDEHLLTIEAEYSALLNDDERANKALQAALIRNPASAVVARSYARYLEATGDFPGAIQVLQRALDVVTGDKRLNAAKARLLEAHFPERGAEAEACWRRSFTEGDTNYTSQSRFARRLYLNGKVDDAILIFDRLKVARVDYEIKAIVFGRVREGGAVKRYKGSIAILESDFAYIQPFGQQRRIHLQASRVDPDTWGRLRHGDSVTFILGFNYFGPAALLV